MLVFVSVFCSPFDSLFRNVKNRVSFETRHSSLRDGEGGGGRKGRYGEEVRGERNLQQVKHLKPRPPSFSSIPVDQTMDQGKSTEIKN